MIPQIADSVVMSVGLTNFALEAIVLIIHRPVQQQSLVIIPRFPPITTYPTAVDAVMLVELTATA